MNLSSVIFTSAAAGGKSAATAGSGSLSAAQPPTGAVKLTVLDSDANNLNLTSATADKSAVKAGDTVEVTFAGAKTGSGAGTPAWEKYVSCVLVNSSGNITHYGKLSNQSGDTADFTVPPAADLPDGTYTLRVFNEQCYDGNYTDYASAPVDITLTVDNVAPTVNLTSPMNGAQNVAIATNTLSVTFDEEMSATPGMVSLSPAGATLTFTGWSTDGKTVNYSLSGLNYGVTYTFDISGFQDVAGNTMAAVTSGFSFETEASAPTINGQAAGTDTLNIVEGYATAFTRGYIIAGAPAPTVSIDPVAPNTAGASFAGNTLIVPTGLLASGSPYTATIKASNSAGDATMTVSVAVAAKPPAPGVNPTGRAIPEGRTEALPFTWGRAAGGPAPTYSGTVKNGRLTFTITKEMLQAALGRAGSNPGGGTLIFKISNTGGFTCQTVIIEEGALDLLKSSGVKYAQVDSALFNDYVAAVEHRESPALNT